MSPVSRAVRAPRTVLAVALASAAVFVSLFALAASAHAATPNPNPSPAATPSAAKPTIVLLHGAWADGSSWAGETRDLQRRGYTVDVPPVPLRGLHADTAYLKDYLKTIKGPLVLGGHSYGGALISAAATGNPNVKALVYVDAFAPAQGETLFGLLTPRDPSQPGLDPNALFNAVPFPGAPKGVVDWYLKPSVFLSTFANDLPRSEAEVLAATQRPIASSAFTEKAGPPAWKTIPSWAVIGTEDRILPPALQEFMATRARAHVTRIKGSHLTLISHPAAVANVILAAAKHAG